MAEIKLDSEMLKGQDREIQLESRSDTQTDYSDMTNKIRNQIAVFKDAIINSKYLRHSSPDSLKALESIRDELAYITIQVEDKIRSVLAREQFMPEIKSWDRKEALAINVINSRAPWINEILQENIVPGMITNEEKRYYQYISRFYSGQGGVVELGPWLGASTRSIVSGLKGNLNFKGKKVFVFDDFIWRSAWMNTYVDETEQLENHADFQSLFEKYSSDILACLDVRKRKITDYDGNQSVKPLEWKRGPIELIFIDCGRTYEANEGWYRIFKNSFIPNRTIIVMQDWRLHREVAVKWYNQTK